MRHSKWHPLMHLRESSTALGAQQFDDPDDAGVAPEISLNLANASGGNQTLYIVSAFVHLADANITRDLLGTVVGKTSITTVASEQTRSDIRQTAWRSMPPSRNPCLRQTSRAA